MSLETLLNEARLIDMSASIETDRSTTIAAYFKRAQEDRLGFWEDRARELHWFKEWDKTLSWNKPHAKWFEGGKLNAAYNCLDLHLEKYGTKTAMIWESEDGTSQHLSYEDLHHRVVALASQLKEKFGIQKGDRVTIYMPMVPELAVAVLACARIGAVHSVVFAGFSATSLRDRIQDSDSKLLISADGGYRRGAVVPLQAIVTEALSNNSCPKLDDVLVYRYISPKEPLADLGDYQVHDYLETVSENPVHHDAEVMDSEDPLFILYTSGTTGKPKGIVHTTGGYMTHAKYSARTVFDLTPNDVYWCTADVGWITGHTYMLYGLLSNAATIVMYEGTPDFPNQSRFWEIIDKHQVSIFYTAPTAIRCFMKWGDDKISDYDLSSLRLLGTVGEPINPEAWMWYYSVIGKERCPIVDTWWQTETGGIMMTTLPSHKPLKPGSAGFALPGISAQIVTVDGDAVSVGGGLLTLTEPWPSMLRGVWGDENRFIETYWSTLDTYFAGDGASIDANGYITVLGRIDDVLNVAGHRIGTMEVESAIIEHPAVAESAVVGIPDDLKGQAIMAFVMLKGGFEESEALISEIRQVVSDSIGPIAKPKMIMITPDLPKTRSGKIMRRILKNLACGDSAGDVTTLGNPDCVKEIEAKCQTL